MSLTAAKDSTPPKPVPDEPEPKPYNPEPILTADIVQRLIAKKRGMDASLDDISKQIDKLETEDAFELCHSLLEKLLTVLAQRTKHYKTQLVEYEALSSEYDLAGLPDNGMIVLNVGGTRFVTSKETLCQDEDSYFAAMLSGRWEIQYCVDLVPHSKAIFIDRSPLVFSHILDFLRGSSFYPTLLTAALRTQLTQEAEFYHIKDLISFLTVDESRLPKEFIPPLFSGDSPIQTALPTVVATSPSANPSAATNGNYMLNQVSTDQKQLELKVSPVQDILDAATSEWSKTSELTLLSAFACEKYMTKHKAEEAELEKKKWVWKTLKERLKRTQISNPVFLNVGGQSFATCIENLQKEPDSYFSSLFSGRWDLNGQGKTMSNPCFIDRSPAVFAFVLEYLRGNSIVKNTLEDVELLKLLDDAGFYQIKGLTDFLVPKNFTFAGSAFMSIKGDRIVSKDTPGHLAIAVDTREITTSSSSLELELVKGDSLWVGIINGSSATIRNTEVVMTGSYCDKPDFSKFFHDREYWWLFDCRHKTADSNIQFVRKLEDNRACARIHVLRIEYRGNEIKLYINRSSQDNSTADLIQRIQSDMTPCKFLICMRGNCEVKVVQQ